MLRRLLILLFVLTLALGLTPGWATTLDAGASAQPLERTSTVRTVFTLDGVTVRAPVESRQVVTVKHRTGYHARIILWQRDADGWQELARAHDGRIGYGGLVAARLRKQATGATPLGTFRLPWAFGMHPRAAAWKLGYRQVQRGDYWVEDNGSAYYNRYRNKAQGGFRWWLPMSDLNSSERLLRYTTQYEYSVVIAFNYYRPVLHRGAGIFFHVNGRAATAGCVSAPRWFLRRAMAWLDPAQQPVIAIGR
jgi:L,D-peptidoglycan transpeptidase YkuD (ErfK/YbiS/YcfS/YnhG family)